MSATTLSHDVMGQLNTYSAPSHKQIQTIYPHYSNPYSNPNLPPTTLDLTRFRTTCPSLLADNMIDICASRKSKGSVSQSFENKRYAYFIQDRFNTSTARTTSATHRKENVTLSRDGIHLVTEIIKRQGDRTV